MPVVTVPGEVCARLPTLVACNMAVLSRLPGTADVRCQMKNVENRGCLIDGLVFEVVFGRSCL